MSFAEDIKTRIKAGYPCLYVTAREDFRCSEEIRATASGLKLGGQAIGFKLWTVTSGFYDQDSAGRMRPTGVAKDPLEALEKASSMDNTVVVFVNMHRSLDDPMVIQTVKDMVQKLKAVGSMAVFVSNVMKVPDELKDDLSFLDFDLPDKRLLAERLDYITAETPGLPSVDRDVASESMLGMTTWEAENALALSVVMKGRIDPEFLAQEKARAVAKTGILEFYEPIKGGMSQVGGLENLKGWLSRRRRAFTQEARDFGLPEPKGVLLVGVPGCGKSLTAKAVSYEWKLPLVRFDMGKVFQGLVGASESRMREAIATMEAVAPVVCWVDEIEKGMAGAGGSGSTDSGVTARVFGTFISWMQDRKRPVFLVATANNVMNMPPELLRAGRWDEVFYVDLPGELERQEILRIHVARRKRDPDKFDLKHIAGVTNLFSGAELEAVVTKGLFRAFSEGRDLSTDDMVIAEEETVPLAVTRREDISAMREWAKTRAVPASRSEPPEIVVTEGKRRVFRMEVSEQDQP